MLRLVLFLALTAASAVLAAWIADRPGRVVVDWLGVELETSVGIALLALLAVAAAAIALFELGRLLWTLPERLAARRARRREEAGRQALSAGLVAAAAGDVATARYHLRQAQRLLDRQDPAVLLLAAQTAQLEGDDLGALRQFQRMLSHPETELLGLRGLLAQAIKAGELDEALRLAREAHRRNPRTPWVVTTLFDLLTRRRVWDEAIQLLGELSALGLVDGPTLARRRAALFLLMAEGARERGRLGEAFDLLRRAVRIAPFFAPAAVQAAQLAAELGRVRLARRLLERAWRAAPHPELAQAHLGLEGELPLAQRLQRLERLRTLQPFHPLSYMLLAEAAMALGELEEAHRLLVRARELEATARVYRLFAELARLRGEEEATVRRWLERAREAPADPAWVDTDTQEILPHWQPFGRTGRFDAVQWTRPARISLLAPDERPTEFLVAPRPSPAREVVPREEARPPAGRRADRATTSDTRDEAEDGSAGEAKAACGDSDAPATADQAGEDKRVAAA